MLTNKTHLYREGMRWRGRLLHFQRICSQFFLIMDDDGERYYWTYLPQWDESIAGNGSGSGCHRNSQKFQVEAMADG